MLVCSRWRIRCTIHLLRYKVIDSKSGRKPVLFPPAYIVANSRRWISDHKLDQINPLMPFSDTTAFITSPSPVQQAAGCTLVAQICSGAPSCNNLHLTGNPNVCTGNGTFTGNTNAGCVLPLTWLVTDPTLTPSKPRTIPRRSVSSTTVPIPLKRFSIPTARSWKIA
jgi:hypothetical protein